MNSRRSLQTACLLLLRKYALVASFAVLTAYLLSPVLSSAFSADDTFDSFLPMDLRYSGETFLSFVNSVVTGWKTNEGRFFPVAVIVGGLSHLIFPEREEYKFAQWVLVTGVVLLFVYFVSYLSRNRLVGLLGGVLLLSVSQMRVQYDPFLQFSLQQPFLTTLILTSALLFIGALRRDSTLLLFLSMFVFFLATLTYESSLLLWPIFPLLAILERSNRIILWVTPTVLPPLLTACHLVYLRAGVESTSSGYTSNFSPSVVLTSLAKQMTGSLPLSYAEINPPGFIRPLPHHLNPTSVVWVICTFGAVLLALYTVKGLRLMDRRQRVALAGIGFTIWIAPSLVVAQTQRWQEELVWGNAYIPVYQGNLGFVLVAISFLSGIESVLRSRRWLISTTRLVFVALVGVSISSVLTNNPRAVAQFDPGYRFTRDLFTNSIERGVFAGVSDGSQLFSIEGEWWFTPAFVSWYGGPKTRTFVTPRDQPSLAACFSNIDTCEPKESRRFAVVTRGRFPQETRTVLVGSIDSLESVQGQLTAMNTRAFHVYVEYPSFQPSPNATESDARCRAWLASQLSKSQFSSLEPVIRVLKATRKSCLGEARLATTVNLIDF